MATKFHTAATAGTHLVDLLVEVLGRVERGVAALVQRHQERSVLEALVSAVAEHDDVVSEVDLQSTELSLAEFIRLIIRPNIFAICAE